MTERKISLDVVTVATPCHEKWDAMQGDDQRRFCDSCAKHVHNLSAMTRDEAEGLMADNPRGMCIRLFRDSDGRVITADRPARCAPRRRAAFSTMSLLGFLAAAGGAALVWFGLGRLGNKTQCMMGVEEVPQHLQPPTMGTPQPVPVMGETMTEQVQVESLKPPVEQLGGAPVIEELGDVAEIITPPQPQPEQPR